MSVTLPAGFRRVSEGIEPTPAPNEDAESVVTLPAGFKRVSPAAPAAPAPTVTLPAGFRRVSAPAAPAAPAVEAPASPAPATPSAIVPPVAPAAPSVGAIAANAVNAPKAAPTIPQGPDRPGFIGGVKDIGAGLARGGVRFAESIPEIGNAIANVTGGIVDVPGLSSAIGVGLATRRRKYGYNPNTGKVEATAVESAIPEIGQDVSRPFGQRIEQDRNAMKGGVQGFIDSTPMLQESRQAQSGRKEGEWPSFRAGLSGAAESTGMMIPAMTHPVAMWATYGAPALNDLMGEYREQTGTGAGPTEGQAIAGGLAEFVMQGGVETLSTALEKRYFGGAKLPAPIKRNLSRTLIQWAKLVAQGYPKAALTELLEETVQGEGSGVIRRMLGMKAADPGEATRQAALPTVLSVAMFGPLMAGSAVLDTRRRAEAVQWAKDNRAPTEIVSGLEKAETPENWVENAKKLNDWRAAKSAARANLLKTRAADLARRRELDAAGIDAAMRRKIISIQQGKGTDAEKEALIEALVNQEETQVLEPQPPPTPGVVTTGPDGTQGTVLEHTDAADVRIPAQAGGVAGAREATSPSPARDTSRPAEGVQGIQTAPQDLEYDQEAAQLRYPVVPGAEQAQNDYRYGIYRDAGVPHAEAVQAVLQDQAEDEADQPNNLPLPPDGVPPAQRATGVVMPPPPAAPGEPSSTPRAKATGVQPAEAAPAVKAPAPRGEPLSPPEPAAESKPQVRPDTVTATEAEAGKVSQKQEVENADGSRHVVVGVRPDGTEKKNYVQTRYGRRVGDAYSSGYPDKVVNFEPDEGATAPRRDGTDVEYVKEVIGKDAIVVGQRRATDSELQSRRDRFEKDQAENGVDEVDPREAKELGYVRKGDKYVYSPAASTAPASAPAAKEPWMMTREEAVAQGIEELVAGGMSRQDAIDLGTKGFEENHRKEVNAAVGRKEPVPPEVLADYPDLKPPAPRNLAELKAKVKGEIPVETPSKSEALKGGRKAGVAWRTAYDETSDQFRRGDILQAVATSKVTDQELSDVLDRTEAIEKDIGSKAANIAWDVSQNNAASPETKARALALREDWTRPGRFAEETPSTPVEAAETAVESKVKVETDADGEKTISIPSKDKPGLPLKDQKKYLLAEIDKAIEAAPIAKPFDYKKTSTDELDAMAKKEGMGLADWYTKYENLAESSSKSVTIEVPGDGTFTLLNDKGTLIEFRQTAAKEFPTSMPGVQGQVGRRTPRDAKDRARVAISVYGSPATAEKTLSSQIETMRKNGEDANEIKWHEATLKAVAEVSARDEQERKEYWAQAWAEEQIPASKKIHAKKAAAELSPMEDEVRAIRDEAEAIWKGKRTGPVPVTMQLFMFPSPAMRKLKARYLEVQERIKKWEASNPTPGTQGWYYEMSDKAPEVPDGWKKGDAVQKYAEPKKIVDAEPSTPTAPTDLASLRAKVQGKKAAPVAPEAEKPAAGIQDFGEKLGGARKDQAPSVEREITDDDLANMTFSEIWPKSEVDAIEDMDMAALATALRNEVPAKPRKGYKVARWVETVKMVRSLMKYANEKGVDAIMARMRSTEYQTLAHFADKVDLLRQLPREHWDRIGKVENNPDAYSYAEAKEGDEGAKKNQFADTWYKTIPHPHATVEVDGRTVTAPSLAELPDAVSERLGVPAESAAMQFEIRGFRRGNEWFINKKGDPLYRKLKTFTGKDAVEQARAFMKDNREDLVAAWEAVKDSDNVKETDVRRTENRPRTGSDWRKGEDATPQMFLDAFGFRGVEFGNWVSQGSNTKERQGMLNQAFDAMQDLAAILGVPPKALSMNGALGLGMGSRGHGWASAHYEPDTIVINLTKTRGAGSLAHELFHAFDHYFQRQRPGDRRITKEGAEMITFQPEGYYEDSKTGTRLSATRFAEIKERGGFRNESDWKRIEGVRPEVEKAFVDLVTALDNSPMSKRSKLIDKGKSGGYWGRIIERAARAFENYVIGKMQQKGYQNDYLANVVKLEEFGRDPERYPYLRDEELAPVSEAFDNLFATIKTRETDRGTAMYAKGEAKPEPVAVSVESLTPEVLNRMNKIAKREGYDSRGTKDVREYLVTGRKLGSGKRLSPAIQNGMLSGDWADFYREATGRVEARKEKAQSLREQRASHTHVNRDRLRTLGYTTDIREAGYITPTGQLIDLSGKREGGSPGARAYDHREAGGTAGMMEFMAEGNIRINGDQGQIDLSAPPTPEQMDVIERIVARDVSRVIIDVSDGLGAWSHEDQRYGEPRRQAVIEPQPGWNARRILNEIRAFYGQPRYSADMLSGQPRGIEPDRFDAVLSDETRAVRFAAEGTWGGRFEDADELVKAAVGRGEGQAAVSNRVGKVLMAEGYTDKDAFDLMTGDRTPEQVVDDRITHLQNLGEMDEPAMTGDQVEMAREEMVSRVREIMATGQPITPDREPRFHRTPTGEVRAVTIGTRSYFFTDRYENESQLRGDIREEAGHRLVNEVGAAEWRRIGFLTYRGRWGEIQGEITRNYGFKPGTTEFNHELIAKAFRDGRQEAGLLKRFMDAVMTAIRGLARRLGLDLTLSDAEVRNALRGMLEAKARGMRGAEGAMQGMAAAKAIYNKKTFTLYNPKSESDSFYSNEAKDGWRVNDNESNRWAIFDREGRLVEHGEGSLSPSVEQMKEWTEAVQKAKSSWLQALPSLIYVRYGNLPKGVSTDFSTGRKERGISVYAATKDFNSNSILPDLNGALPAAAIVRASENATVFLVTGRKVGTGADGEPVIKNPSVITQLQPYSGVDGYGFVLPSDSRIKSADPITRDDQGRVIPLSERFNEKSPDIRYAKGEAQQGDSEQEWRNYADEHREEWDRLAERENNRVQQAHGRDQAPNGARITPAHDTRGTETLVEGGRRLAAAGRTLVPVRGIVERGFADKDSRAVFVSVDQSQDGIDETVRHETFHALYLSRDGKALALFNSVNKGSAELNKAVVEWANAHPRYWAEILNAAFNRVGVKMKLASISQRNEAAKLAWDHVTEELVADFMATGEHPAIFGDASKAKRMARDILPIRRYQEAPDARTPQERALSAGMAGGYSMGRRAALNEAMSALERLKKRVEAAKQAGKATEGQPDQTPASIVRDAVQAGETRAKLTVGEMLSEFDDGKAANAILEGRMGIRAAANRLVSAKMGERMAIQRELVQAMRKAIPDATVRNSLSNNILRMLVDRTTSPQKMQAALGQIDRIMDKQQRKALIGAIKAVYSKAVDSMAVNVGYRQRIRALMDGFLLTKPTKATMDKARELADFLESEAASGSDMDLTLNLRMAVLLGKLGRVPLADLDVGQLQDIFSELSLLETTGKLYQQGKRQREIDRMDSDMAEVRSQGVRKFDAPTREIGIIGDPPRFTQRFVDAMAGAGDGLRKWYRWHLPTDRQFDLMDNYQHYKGVLYRFYKGRANMAFKLFRADLYPVEQELKDVLSRHKIGKREAIRIGVYGVDQQTMENDPAYGRKKLYNTFGADTEERRAEIDRQVDAIELTPDEQSVYEWMLEKFESVAPALQRVANDVYNVEFDKVKKYWPMQTDWELTENDPVAGYEMNEFGQLMKKNPEKGMIKTRTGAGDQRVQIDSARGFIKHMSDAYYMIHMAPATKYMAELARRPDMLAAVGKEGQRMLLEFTDTMARKGGVNGDHVMRGADMLRRNVGVGTLGFRITSALIQPTSFINAIGILGPRGFKGAYDITQPGRIRWILDNSSEIRDSVGDDLALGDWGAGRVYRKMIKAGYWTLVNLDRLTRCAVFAAAYEANLRERGMVPDYSKPADQEAMLAAENIVRVTQASGSFKDTPTAITRSKLFGSSSLAKMFYQFQSFPMNTFAYVAHDGIGNALNNKEWGKAANMVLWTTLAFMAEEGIRTGISSVIGGGGGDDRDYTEEVIWDFLGTVPLFGQLAGSIRYSSVPIPLVSAVAKVSKGMTSAVRGKAPTTRQRGAVRTAGALATLAGVPGSSQVSDIISRRIQSDNDRIRNMIEDSAKRLNRTPSAGMMRDSAQKVYDQAKRDGLVPRGTSMPSLFLLRYKIAHKRINEP